MIMKNYQPTKMNELKQLFNEENEEKINEKLNEIFFKDYFSKSLFQSSDDFQKIAQSQLQA